MANDDFNKFLMDFSNFDFFDNCIDLEASREKLKSMREMVNWEIEAERDDFYWQLCNLIRYWQGRLPNLRLIFRKEEIDWLLVKCVKFGPIEVISFVKSTGYRDEPDLDEGGKPLLRHTTPIHYAARHENNQWISKVRELFGIYDKFEANYVDESGLSHFRVACVAGHEYIVKKFLESGQDPNCLEPESGDSLLHLAVQHKQKKVMKLLLSRGANPNLTNNEGSTPLHIICKKYDDIDLAKILFEVSDEVDRPVQIDRRNKQGETPLNSCRGNKQMIELMLEKGANPNLANDSGWTPLHRFCTYRNYDDAVVRRLFELGDEECRPVHIDAQTKGEGRTPLHMALHSYKWQVAEFLLRRGADPNLADSRGYTALHVLCQSECGRDFAQTFFRIIDEVQRTSLKVDAWTKDGWTPLKFVIVFGYEYLLEALLRRGADPNLVDDKGRTPLFDLACSHWCVSLTDKFFEVCDDMGKTVRVDVLDESGRSPLHYALGYNFHKKASESLLKRGLDQNLADANGWTPLHMICRRNRRHDDDSAEKFFEMCRDNQLTVQVDVRDKFGKTPLQMAVAHLLPYTVDFLLNEAGADLSSFVFPTEADFVTVFDENRCVWNKAKLAAGLLACVERLEKVGYELDRSDALIIVNIFAKYELFQKPEDLEKCWYEDKEFAEMAKTIKILPWTASASYVDHDTYRRERDETRMTPSLSLYDLVLLRPDEAKKVIAYDNYYEIKNRYAILDRYLELCWRQLCENMSRRFFLSWALEPLLELTRCRLPVLCCEMILEGLNNEDLFGMCQAAEIAASEKEGKTCDTGCKENEVEKS